MISDLLPSLALLVPPVRLRIAIVADAQAVLAVLLQGVTSLAFHTGEVEDVDDDSGHSASAKGNHSYGGDGDARNRPFCLFMIKQSKSIVQFQASPCKTTFFQGKRHHSSQADSIYHL